MNVTVIQPALPFYRLAFFDRVHALLGDRFRVVYSPTHLSGLTKAEHTPVWAKAIGTMRAIAPGLEWQDGALSQPIKRGDVLVVCGAPRTISTLALIAKAKLRGAKVIWWGHFWSSTSKPWRFRLRMKLLSPCDGLLFYTDDEVEEFRKFLGHEPAMSVRALNNGINTAPIIAERAAYSAASRERALLFIGRLTAKASLATLLDALGQIPRAECPHLHIIGDGEERAALEQLAEELGIALQITWHGAITDEARIAAIANRCRLFAYPGEVGLSLIHAMAYGLPAVVHNERWRQMPEFAAFEAGVTGRSFAMGDAADLANQLSQTLEDSPALDLYSFAAIARTSASYNTHDMAQRFTAMVRMVADGGDGDD